MPTRNFIAHAAPLGIEAESIRERFSQSLFGSVQRKENNRLELNWAQQTQRCQPSLSDRRFRWMGDQSSRPTFVAVVEPAKKGQRHYFS